MARYLLADFVINIEHRYDFLPRQCAQYRYEGAAPADFTVRVTDAQLQQEQQSAGERVYPAGYLESVCTYRQLCLGLPQRDAFLMHGSVISCEGRGIAFLARSGVGKTTHTMLWKQAFGEQVQIINGDKPIIRFFDGTPYAYGTPWAGKENLHCNRRVALTDLCLIRRSKENSVTRADPVDHLGMLMQQILHPSESAAAARTLELLDQLLSGCRLWVVDCNVSEEAAIIAHDAIMGEV